MLLHVALGSAGVHHARTIHTHTHTSLRRHEKIVLWVVALAVVHRGLADLGRLGIVHGSILIDNVHYLRYGVQVQIKRSA